MDVAAGVQQAHCAPSHRGGAGEVFGRIVAHIGKFFIGHPRRDSFKGEGGRFVSPDFFGYDYVFRIHKPVETECLDFVALCDRAAVGDNADSVSGISQQCKGV